MGETTRIESPECRGAWREGGVRCGEEGWTLLTLAEWMPGERRAEDRDRAVELLVKRTFWIADGPNAAQVLPVCFRQLSRRLLCACMSAVVREAYYVVAAEGLPVDVHVGSGPIGNHGITAWGGQHQMQHN
jgi:hypothetical protein